MMTRSKKPIVSIIIPTCNRALSLRRTLQSVINLNFPYKFYEIIVVDNNSIDKTHKVVQGFLNKKSKISIRYIKEFRLSFTVARHTGAEAAKGKILSYIDDDVVVSRNWLSAVVDIFKQNKKAGIVGGPILPKFETKPPDWIKKYYPMSGWLSLLDRGKKIHETHDVFGPNFSIRKKVLDLVGGFPADTIGVEAEGRPGVVEKIYVGSGDVGLCAKAKKTGYKVIYAPGALVYHVIPPVRLTKKWWHSRFAGEGCFHALAQQYENEEARIWLFMRGLYSFWKAVKTMIKFAGSAMIGAGKERHEFWISYYLSRAKIEFILIRHPELARRLHDAALTGLLAQDADQLVRLLS